MTTTTKIFVILVCLFAFIFTPMAIQFAARSENWRSQAEQYRTNVTIANAHLQSLKSFLDAREADWKRKYDEQAASANELQAQIAKLQHTIDTLTQERDQLARSREMLETQTGVLTAELSLKSKHNDELTDSREKALARERELQTGNGWLTDQLQLRRAEVDVLKQQLNQRQQEMLSCRKENEDLRRTQNLGKAAEPVVGTTGGTVEPLTPATRSKITGKVKQIRGNLVSIDVGSASGVREGMRMIVLRNGSYVGDIKITSSTPSEAVGEIALLGPEGKQIRAGDDVIDEAAFSAG